MNPDTKRMNRTSIPKAENRPIIDPKISPDNQNICAYYSQNDLYVQDLTKGRFSRYLKCHFEKFIFEKNPFLEKIHFRKKFHLKKKPFLEKKSIFEKKIVMRT